MDDQTVLAFLIGAAVLLVAVGGWYFARGGRL